MPNPVSQPCAVAVTAAGVVSPLGFGLGGTLASLRAGRDCVSPVTRFDVSRTRSKTAGQVEDFRFQISDFRLPERKARRLHRASRMMIAAIRELFTQDQKFAP